MRTDWDEVGTRSHPTLPFELTKVSSFSLNHDQPHIVRSRETLRPATSRTDLAREEVTCRPIRLALLVALRWSRILKLGHIWRHPLRPRGLLESVSSYDGTRGSFPFARHNLAGSLDVAVYRW